MADVTRAARRAQHWRAVARAQRLVRNVWILREPWWRETLHTYRWAVDRKPCSCWACSVRDATPSYADRRRAPLQECEP